MPLLSALLDQAQLLTIIFITADVFARQTRLAAVCHRRESISESGSHKRSTSECKCFSSLVSALFRWTQQNPHHEYCRWLQRDAQTRAPGISQWRWWNKWRGTSSDVWAVLRSGRQQPARKNLYRQKCIYRNKIGREKRRKEGRTIGRKKFTEGRRGIEKWKCMEKEGNKGKRQEGRNKETKARNDWGREDGKTNKQKRKVVDDKWIFSGAGFISQPVISLYRMRHLLVFKMSCFQILNLHLKMAHNSFLSCAAQIIIRIQIPLPFYMSYAVAKS